MKALLALCRGIDAMSERIGRSVYWLLLAAVVVSTANALARYLFDIGSNAFLEAQWYMFAAIYLLGAGWVLLHDAHVRIDVVASRFPRRWQVMVDVVGILFFLLPLTVFIAWTALPPMLLAIETNEVSASPGGLLRWPLYALVPVGFALLFAQALSELFKRIAFLTGDAPDPHARHDETDEERLLAQLKREAEEREAREAAQAAATATSQGGRA
ncbi:MAG: TRAP transporter small permease subunit [Rubrivivax sp.]|nr:TRAP transporter small permease subunit [Rubrivivax sp.]